MEETQLFAQIMRIKDLCSALKVLDLKNHTIMSIKPDGMQLSTEKENSLQLSVFLKEDFFQTFKTSSNNSLLSINMSVVLESLAIFDMIDQKDSGHCVDLTIDSMKLTFSTETTDYSIISAINTSSAEDIADFGFCPDNISGKAIMKAHILRNFLFEIDSTADSIGISFSSQPQSIRFIATGFFLCSEIQLANNDEDVEEFSCHKATEFKYSASLFKYCFPSLQNSSKISLRIDCHGVLCMHSLMQFTNNRVAFTEFLLRPQISPNQHVSITNE
ncbi:hypothetical protein GJ496_008759 [Pomphorhynchus laevis]|nr:hypothetical protein GJ496_008759 [Pomphorhynchus laevis]